MKKTIVITILILIVLSFSAAALTGALPKMVSLLNTSDIVNEKTVPLESITLDEDTFNKLAAFFAENNIDDKTQEYIINLIKKGYNADYVITVAEFWQKTDYECSLMEQILSQIPKDTKKLKVNIVSCIFDKISKNASGVLKIDEANKYLEAGLSISDLHAANEISKKGVCDIHEILDKTCKNGNMNKVIVEVYSKVKREKYDFSDIKDDDFKKIKNPKDLISAVKLSRLKNKKVKEIIENKSEGFEAEYNVEVNNRKDEARIKLSRNDVKIKGDPVK